MPESVYAAVLVAGHLRTFNQCQESIQRDVIDPLKQEGYIVNVFIATWATEFPEITLENAHIIMERDRPDRFIKAYVSHRAELAGNAAAMWNRVELAYELMRSCEHKHGYKHSLIVRTRPDVCMRVPLQPETIKLAASTTALFMAVWNNVNERFTHQMMDHFALGQASIMQKYCTTFSSISSHDRWDGELWCTGEGFLYAHLCALEVPIHRTPFKYALIREDGSVDEATNKRPL